MSMMAYTRSIPIIRNGSGIWLPVRVCYRKNRIDRGFYASYIKRECGSEKEKVQMNLHPTDSGDRNTQDEAKHFHTVGFLF